MRNLVNTTIENKTGIIELNRPDVRNALNLALRLEFQAAVEAMDEDPKVQVIILTGAGRTFCAGRDLKAAKAGELLYRDRLEASRTFQRAGTRKPVIAAVEGYALGGGFELALSCDLIIAAESAKFGLPEVKRNLVAIGGGLIRLPVRAPYHVAMNWALTGKMIAPAELERWGIVAQVTEHGGALNAAKLLSREITANGPSALRATKEIIRNSHEWGSEKEAWDAQMAMADPALKSTDHSEGIQAFIEKREPRWVDN